MVEGLTSHSELKTGDPAEFGAGALQAEVRYRADTVAYGYQAVVSEFCDPYTGVAWCTLAVSLPTSVPTLTIDHRSAVGRAGVPMPGLELAPFGERLFDHMYLVTCGYLEDASRMAALVGAPLRDVALRNPVQRLAFSGSELLLRTFDGPRATDEVTEWLERVAGLVLAATPAFGTLTGENRPFPPGLYRPHGTHRSGAGHRREGRRDGRREERRDGWRSVRAWLDTFVR